MSFIPSNAVKTSAFFLLAMLFCGWGPVFADAERPNILWLSIEDASRHLGVYGSEHARTPNLDSLAAAGVRFDRAYASAPVCAVARSSLITGIYSVAQGSHFMRTDIIRPEEIKPFPWYLRQAGYFTSNRQKTDYQFDIPEGVWDRQGPDHSDWEERSNPDQPFFSVINFGGTHESKNIGDYDPELFDPAELELPAFYPDTPKVRQFWASYYQNMHKADLWLGENLQRLSEQGLADNTIVVFWSDHGVGFPRGKRWVYEMGLNVPMIVYIPDKWRSQFSPVSIDGVNSELVNFIDFAPTMLGIAGVAAPGHMQGRAFMGPDAGAPPEVLFAHRDRMDERNDIIRTVIGERFKYIRNFEYFKPHMQFQETAEIHAWNGITAEIRRLHESSAGNAVADWYFSYKKVEELYDLSSDPQELKNLAFDPEYQSQLVLMREHMKAEQDRIGDLGAVPESLLRQWRTRFGSEYAIRTHQRPLLDSAWEVLWQLHELNHNELDDLLGHENAAVRYWAAIGLGNLAAVHELHSELQESLGRALLDSERIVQIAGARGLLLLGESPEALSVLAGIIQDRSLHWVDHLAAMQAIDLAGARALPIREILQAAEFDKKYPKRVRDELLPRIDIAPARVPPPPAKPESHPNVLLILVDDMGWSDIGSYGGEIQTPNLDRLAKRGLRLTQFHNTSKCFPSRATLLTGLYAQQSGMLAEPGAMKTSVTLAEVLRGAGYRTLMVGKHHGTDNPVDFGFDRYAGLRDGASNHFNPGLQRQGEAMPAQKRYGERVFCFDHDCQSPWTPPNRDFYSTDDYTRWAMDYLKEYQSEDRPWFLYLSYQAPHDPLQAWPDDIDRYRDVYKAGYEAITAARLERQKKMGLIDETWPLARPSHRPWESLSADEQAEEANRMAVYAAMIDRVDQNLGELFALIAEQGEWENTLVLFASDNGSSSETVNKHGEGEMGSLSRWTSLEADWANVSNTPFRYFKNFSHQGGITTPLIAHWPVGIRQTGRISSEPGHFIDVMATLVDITGAAYPPVDSAASLRGEMVPDMAGSSLLPLFEGTKGVNRQQPLFWQWQNGRAVRDGRWKLVSLRVKKTDELMPWELYDMSVDKTETRNLAAQYPDVVERLAKAHQQWFSDKD